MCIVSGAGHTWQRERPAALWLKALHIKQCRNDNYKTRQLGIRKAEAMKYGRDACFSTDEFLLPWSIPAALKSGL